MPMQFWSKDGKIIVDAQGRPILCDRCPCGNCPDFPAGSVLEMEVTHAITRTKSRLESSDAYMSVPYVGGTELSVTYEKKITIAFTADNAIPFHYPYPEWYPSSRYDGRVIFWRGEEYPALQPTVSVSVTGSASEWYILGGSYEERAYYEPVRRTDEQKVIYVVRNRQNGNCVWNEMEVEGVLSGYAYSLAIDGIYNYTWQKTSGDAMNLNYSPLVKSGYFADGFTGEYSGVKGTGDIDTAGFFQPLFTFVTVSPYEGTASWDVSMRRESSYHIEERSGAEGWLSTYEGQCTDVLHDTMTAHWLITPPTMLWCASCGL